MLFFHVFGYEMIGDDIGVFAGLKPTLIEEVLNIQNAFYSWSSRIFINPCIWIVSHLDIKIWSIINVLFLCLSFYLVDYLCEGSKKTNCEIVLFVMLIFPFCVLTDVGWISTSVSYLWPLVAGLFSCVSIRKYYDNEKLRHLICFLICISTAFAANKEELSLALSIIFLFFLCLSLVEKRFNPLFAIQFLISIENVLFHLLYTGNSLRYNATTSSEVPMAGLSVVDKIIIGFVSTLNHLFYGYDYLFLCFCIIICVLLFMIEERRICRLISIIPVCICLVSMIIGIVISNGIIDSKALSEKVYPSIVISNRGMSYNYFQVLIPVVISLVGICCLLFEIYCIQNDKKSI